MIKRVLFLSCAFLTAACSLSPRDEEQSAYEEELPFYEKAYALPVEAAEWAKTAPLKDLCQATKNWHHKYIRNAALDEIKARDIDTKECYYTGMELTP